MVLGLLILISRFSDVISHNRLLKKMNFYGLTTAILNLIKAFFSDRCQVVSVKNKQSKVKPVVFGVPQGSVLGYIIMTSLFLYYLEDCDMLADKTTIHISGRDMPSTVVALQSCVLDLIEWTHIKHVS